MTQREMELMKALTAAQAALWEVVDNEHGALDMLTVMLLNIAAIFERLMKEKRT